MSNKDLQRVTESLSDIGQGQTPHTTDTPFVNLSPKEEAFCLAIVEGLNESDAYRKAYKPQRAKAKTIHEKASRIMARGKDRGVNGACHRQGPDEPHGMATTAHEVLPI